MVEIDEVQTHRMQQAIHFRDAHADSSNNVVFGENISGSEYGKNLHWPIIYHHLPVVIMGYTFKALDIFINQPSKSSKSSMFIGFTTKNHHQPSSTNQPTNQPTNGNFRDVYGFIPWRILVNHLTFTENL